MNTVAHQAKNGFKTFVLTFVVSLLVFGAFYYLISDTSVGDVSIEDSSELIGYTSTVADIGKEEVLGEEESVEEESVEEESPFGTLAEQEVEVQQRAVLQSADEATDGTEQSTVPDTGAAGITIGLIGSVVLFAFFAYIVLLNPRKYALSRFEKDAMRGFD